MTEPLGYRSAVHALSRGRAAFFGSMDRDLPKNRSKRLREHDLTPSFGYVGKDFARNRVLFLGIHPGKGPSKMTPGDQRMMPILGEFSKNPSIESFKSASQAFKDECQDWPIWKKVCIRLMEPSGLTFEQIAYSNCFPWRTKSDFRVNKLKAANAMNGYVAPLIKELKPKIVVALTKGAEKVVIQCDKGLLEKFELVSWNGNLKVDDAIRKERESAIRALKKAIADRRR